jgi:hypothetical protein
MYGRVDKPAAQLLQIVLPAALHLPASLLISMIAFIHYIIEDRYDPLKGLVNIDNIFIYFFPYQRSHDVIPPAIDIE